MAVEQTFPDPDSLIDRELILKWTYWGLFWLMFTPSIGVTISSLFNYPDYLGTSQYLTFGRLRPMHVNGVIFGAFSTLFMALCYYIVPRLCGVRVWKERWGHSLMLGYNQGLEAGEFPLLIDAVIFFVITVVTVQFLVTIAQRREPQLYVSLWYLIGAFVWTVINLILGSFILPYAFTGINSAAWHGLFLHYIVGLWITPAGYVLIYYFLPASVRNPIYSHKLSLVGFWSLALFYPFVGIHHYLYSPIADWAETLAIITSMLLIVPVWTVLQNFFGTMIGRWHTFGQNLTAKFMIMGALMYLVGCFQGSTEALRSIQEPTHFSDFVISHSHLTVFGTFVVWAIGGIVHVVPKLVGRPLWSFTMGNWSFWLITSGITLMGLDLTLAGLQQGFMLMAGAEWVDTLVSIRPYWLVRTIAGTLMDIGMSLLVFNLMRTVISPARLATPAAGGRAPGLAGVTP
jgi:cytochrome c oxidase cbb3-type subunit 1